MQKQVISKSLIVSTLLLISTAAFATEMNNELVKMDINQTSDGSVKFNIYTDKPYNDKIIVNKKNDNKYVILLPETTNSSNIKPDISNISSLNNVEVKTQQYSSLPGKDYTKIIIDSKNPINIVPQAHVAKKVASERKLTTRPSLSAQQVQKALPQRVVEQQHFMTNNDFRSNSRQNTNFTQPNYVARPQETQTIIRREAAPMQQSSQLLKREEDTSILKQVSQTEQVVIREDNANSALTQNEQVALEDSASENQVAKNEDNKLVTDNEISEKDLAFFKKIIKFKQKVKSKIKSLLSVKISFASFMVVLQLVLLIVLIKVVVDLIKKLQNQDNTAPTSKRLILNNEETFEQNYPSYSNMDVYNTNKSNFEEDNKEGFNMMSRASAKMFSNSSKFQKSLYSNNYQQEHQYSVQNDFYKPISAVSKEEKMSIFDESSQDIEKSIFKNPLISISKQDEETLFDEPEPIEENTPFNNDTYSIQEQEEDFFIFEDEDEEENFTYQEDYIDDESEQEESEEYFESEDDIEDEYEYEYVDDSESDEDEIEEEIDEVEPQEEVNPLEQLSVHAKYEIDSNRGFAQVNVNGINALIGYVGSNVCVIRKFKEEIKGSMQVRLNEQSDNGTSIYIIKVGGYKTLVEVKPDSIRQLLDL